MEKKQSEIKTAQQVLDEKDLHWTYAPNGDYTQPMVHDCDCRFCEVEDRVLEAMEEYAQQFDRESPPVMPKHAGNRFEIENSGRPFLAFETEAHIVDDQNPGCTIIVKSGYSTLEETYEYANKILKILNDGSL